VFLHEGEQGVEVIMHAEKMKMPAIAGKARIDRAHC
jgi:hypothetical protein